MFYISIQLYKSGSNPTEIRTCHLAREKLFPYDENYSLVTVKLLKN